MNAPVVITEVVEITDAQARVLFDYEAYDLPLVKQAARPLSSSLSEYTNERPWLLERGLIGPKPEGVLSRITDAGRTALASYRAGREKGGAR